MSRDYEAMDGYLCEEPELLITLPCHRDVHEACDGDRCDCSCHQDSQENS